MTDDASRRDGATPPGRPGADVPDAEEMTGPGGTPVPVDITRDLESRPTWLVLLGGPVIWAVHFIVVYLVAEAGCTGSGPGLEAFDPPVPATTTLVATVLAVVGCLGVGLWGWRRSRGLPEGVAADEPAARERHRVLSLAGVLLAGLSLLAVLFVAAPAVWLPC